MLILGRLLKYLNNCITISLMYYTFDYYTYLDFRDISRFSHCTKLSQCREQEGSATLVIVTLHLLSTLQIYKINDIPLTIFLFAITLRYDVGLFCQGILMFLTVQTPHSCSSFSSSVHHCSHLPNDEGTCRKGKLRNVAYNNM